MSRRIGIAVIVMLVAVAATSFAAGYAASTLWADMDAIAGEAVTSGLNAIGDYSASGCVSVSWTATLANGQQTGGGVAACH